MEAYSHIDTFFLSMQCQDLSITGQTGLCTENSLRDPLRLRKQKHNARHSAAESINVPAGVF